MDKKILIGSIIAVALIVLSSFSSVVGKVESSDELVELDVEFYGLDKKQTVKLTQEEADEVEQLFDDIDQQLSQVGTREEAEEIFNDAIDVLYNLDLIPHYISKKKAQNFVTGKFSNLFEYRLTEFDILRDNVEYSNAESNSNCLIVGESTEEFILTWYQGLPFRMANILAWYIAYFAVKLDNDALMDKAVYIMSVLSLIFSLKLFTISLPYSYNLDPFFQRPIIRGGSINYGIQDLLFGETIPSEGWVSTYGLEGHKNWSGGYLWKSK